jgi:GGDEF domain-containing protein
LDKVVNLADDHSLTSVVVGMTGSEGDLVFPEVVDFVGSALRIDDAIFRMTRDRAVLFLADADRERAQEIVERVMEAFAEQFATSESPKVEISYFEVAPGKQDLTLKNILPLLFARSKDCH